MSEIQQEPEISIQLHDYQLTSSLVELRNKVLECANSGKKLALSGYSEFGHLPVWPVWGFDTLNDRIVCGGEDRSAVEKVLGAIFGINYSLWCTVLKLNDRS